MITESGVVFPAQEQAVQSDAKSAENTGKTKKASEKNPVQTPDETAGGASATASENLQLTRYLAQEYGGDWAQTVTPKQLQKAKYRLGLAVTDDPALNTPLYNNLTPDAVQELKREYGRRWWDKATEEDVLIVQQASLAGKDSAVEGIAQGSADDTGNSKIESSNLQTEAVGEFSSESEIQRIIDVVKNYKLSDDTLDNHILDRHGPGSEYKNKSHFNPEFDVKDGIDSVLRNANFVVGSNTQGREGYIFEKTFSKSIGVNSKGKSLYTLKIVIDKAGNIITAFPKK